METSLSLRPKLPAVPVITSVEKECTCCLLYPIGNESSAWSPSPTLNSPCMPLLVKDLVNIGLVDRPKVFCQTHCASNKNTDHNKKWNEWVKAMACKKKFLRTWQQAGIIDALIVNSVASEIKIDQQMMEALLGFWCPGTNTFIFQWGEAGFSPEDLHVFTALPLRGSDLNQKLTTREEGLKNRLIVEAEKILVLDKEARCTGMVTNDIWLEWFINEKDIDDELKHLGFLTCWLCKDVFPSAKLTPALFGLAARLSLGDKIALAPAVVANIYHDLNLFTASIISSQRTKSAGQLKASTLFGFLQCWVWERFESLRPEMYASIFQQSRVRIARWSSVQSKTGYNKAMEIFQDERCFTWRPYSCKLINWVEPEWYKVDSQNIITEAEKTPIYVYDFLALVSCTSVTGLASDGLTFSECYRPNRFARQFGFDQAIPGAKGAYRTFSHHASSTVGVQIYIPAITRHGNPRTDYVKWWKAHIKNYGETLMHDFMPSAATEMVDKDIKKNRMEEKLKPELGDEDDNSSKKRKGEEINKQQSVTKREQSKKLQQMPNRSPLNSSSYASNEKLVRTSGLQFVDGTETTTAARDGASCCKYLSIINIDSDDEDNPTTPNVSSTVFAPEDTTNTIDNDELALAEELEQFQHHRLLFYQEPNPEIDNCSSKLFVRRKHDPYGQEAIDCYPNFFHLIPQHPHYKGLLEGQQITEEMKRHIFLGQWFMLARLMEEALSTNAQTNVVRIEQMFLKARMLERNGFDVRHLIARLKLVRKRITEKSTLT